MAVNIAPGSIAFGNTSPARRKCALDEIGMNSVRPWMIPRIIASNISSASPVII
jgi:hypothetical protein